MMKEEEIIVDTTKRMEGAIASLKHALSGLRTGRASAHLLDQIKVEAYGSFTPLSQVATISVPEARLITIQVWDKSVTKHVEKAVADSGLGLNPTSEGQIVRVPIPNLSEERRKELSRKVGEYSENAKIAVRNVRRDNIDHLKKMEKEKLLSKDELKDHSDKIQDLTDDYIAKIGTLSVQKTQEIMTI